MVGEEKHIFPFVGSTIRTNLSYAFVVVAGTRQRHTGDIKENATVRTFLWHAFLVDAEKWRLPIVPNYTEDGEKRRHASYSILGTMIGMGTTWVAKKTAVHRRHASMGKDTEDYVGIRRACMNGVGFTARAIRSALASKCSPSCKHRTCQKEPSWYTNAVPRALQQRAQRFSLGSVSHGIVCVPSSIELET